MRGWRALTSSLMAALLMAVLLATPLAAQGPRIEPPAGGIFGPLPGTTAVGMPSV